MKLDPKEHNKPVPKLWYRILITIHGITGLSIIGSTIANKPWLAVGVSITGYILDQIIRFIKQDNPNIDA